MSREADEIREEIDRARGELGETLEAIGDRVAPKHVAQRVKGDVDDKIDAIGDKVSPRRIFRRRTESIRTGLRNRGGSGMESGIDVGGESTVETGSANGDGTASAGGVASQAQSLRQRLRRASGTAVGQVTSAPAQARARSESNPLVAGLMAFGGGLAVAALLPPSDRERQAAARMKGRIEPLKQQAVEAGKSVADELKPVAQSSLEQVKGRAAEAAEELKGQAQGRAEALKDDAKQVTTAVKGQSRTAAQTVKGSSQKAAGTVRTSAKQTSKAVKGTAKQTVAKKAPRSGSPVAAGAAGPAKRTSGPAKRVTGTTKAPAAAKAPRAAKVPAAAKATRTR